MWGILEGWERGRATRESYWRSRRVSAPITPPSDEPGVVSDEQLEAYTCGWWVDEILTGFDRLLAFEAWCWRTGRP